MLKIENETSNGYIIIIKLERNLIFKSAAGN